MLYLGKKGIASSEGISIGGAGMSAMYSNQYNFNFTGTGDRVAGTPLPAANYEGVHYNLHGSTLVTYTKDEYVRDAAGRILTFGAYTRVNKYPVTPTSWGDGGAVIADTDVDIGPFNICTITDDGANTNDAIIWTNAGSGNPSGRMYFEHYYNEGTSGAFCLKFSDGTLGDTFYRGDVGSAAIVANDTAGNLVILSDALDSDLNMRVIKGTFLFITATNVLSISFGPYSADGSNVVVGGAHIINVATWRPFTAATEGSTLAVSSTAYDNNGGSPRGIHFALSDVPGVVDGVDGVVTGIDIIGTYFTGWSFVGAITISGTGFISTAAPGSGVGVVKNLSLVPGTTYLVDAQGTDSSSAMEIYSIKGVITTPRTLINTGFGTFRFTPATDYTGIYVRVVGPATVNFSTFTVREVSHADGQIEWRGTPLFSAADTAADGKIITVNETGTLLAHTPEGEFESSDGTQAANYDVDYVKDTEYLVKIPYGDKAGADKQQVIVNGVAGDLADFDGSFNPDTYLGIGGSAFPMAHSSLKIRKKAQW